MDSESPIIWICWMVTSVQLACMLRKMHVFKKICKLIGICFSKVNVWRGSVRSQWVQTYVYTKMCDSSSIRFILILQRLFFWEFASYDEMGLLPTPCHLHFHMYFNMVCVDANPVHSMETYAAWSKIISTNGAPTAPLLPLIPPPHLPPPKKKQTSPAPKSKPE